MKKLFTSIVLLVMVSFSFSCSSDGDDTSNAELTIAGEKLQVTLAQLLTVSGNENNYTFSISDASDVTNIKSLLLSITFPVEASVTGEYAYPESGERNLLSISSYSRLSTQTGSLLDGTGTVRITDHTDNRYTLNVNMTMGDGTAIRGSYTGTFLTQQ